MGRFWRMGMPLERDRPLLCKLDEVALKPTPAWSAVLVPLLPVLLFTSGSTIYFRFYTVSWPHPSSSFSWEVTAFVREPLASGRMWLILVFRTPQDFQKVGEFPDNFCFASYSPTSYSLRIQEKKRKGLVENLVQFWAQFSISPSSTGILTSLMLSVSSVM